MKKLIVWVTVATLTLSLMACAATSKKQGSRVKCPACGYEFDTPVK